MNKVVAALYVDETTGEPIEIFPTVEELTNAHPWADDWDERSCVVVTRATLNKINELANVS